MTEIGKPVFEATPTDGQTEKGPDSNWAYDHAHDPDAHGNDLYPWMIFIHPFHTPKSQINFNTISLGTSRVYNAHLVSSSALNAEITWDVVLAKGTWNVEILMQTNIDIGIHSVQFDSVEKGTIDGYQDPAIGNYLGSVTGIVVPVTKKIALKIKITGKNTSSSGYGGTISSIQLTRTS